MFDLHNGYMETGQGTFRGELKAASGTFSGELQAASGSFTGSVEVDDGTAKSILLSDGELTFSDETKTYNSGFKQYFFEILFTRKWVLKAIGATKSLQFMAGLVNMFGPLEGSAAIDLGLNGNPWRGIFGTRLYLDDDADSSTKRVSGAAAFSTLRFDSGDKTQGDVYMGIVSHTGSSGTFGVIGSYNKTAFTSMAVTSSYVKFYNYSSLIYTANYNNSTLIGGDLYVGIVSKA